MAEFQVSSPIWQIQQWQRRVMEWWEWWMSQGQRPSSSRPDWEFPAWLLPILLNFGKVLLVLLILWLSWSLAQFLSPQLRDLRQRWRQVDSPVSPQVSQRSVAGWLDLARAMQQRGNYRDACRFLYMALLQQLHDLRIVSHQVSRTDGEYISALGDSPQLGNYQTVIRTHEQICFSREPVSAELFERCQEAFLAGQTPMQESTPP
jgi:hypothetical protein